VLPVVERHARVVFRHWNRSDREEAVAEAVASAFVSVLALGRRGRDVSQFPSQVARYAALCAQSGRQVGSRSSARDVLSRTARLRHGFRVQRLPHSGEACSQAFVSDQTPIPEQVALRIDFPEFLRTLSRRERQMALQLAEGWAAKVVAHRFGLSPGRVTQLRQQWHDEWRAFHRERQDGAALDNSRPAASQLVPA